MEVKLRIWSSWNLICFQEGDRNWYLGLWNDYFWWYSLVGRFLLPFVKPLGSFCSVNLFQFLLFIIGFNFHPSWIILHKGWCIYRLEHCGRNCWNTRSSCLTRIVKVILVKFFC